jgi:hypothetical protein
MVQKDKAFLVGATLAALLLVAVGFAPRLNGAASAETPAHVVEEAAPELWNYGPPPENEPVIGLWERTEPGYFDAYEVVRIGAEYVADMPSGQPTVCIERDTPYAWARLP